jgi:hypothetical protein
MQCYSYSYSADPEASSDVRQCYTWQTWDRDFQVLLLLLLLLLLRRG